MTEEKKDELFAEETVTEPDKTETTFTQGDVDKIIKERLARAKEQTNRVQTAFDSYKENTEAILEEHKANAQTQVEALSVNVPENVKSILGKLTVFEQLKWLSDPKNQIENRGSPKTPPAAKERKVIVEEEYEPII